jgi:hypothetical protein
MQNMFADMGCALASSFGLVEVPDRVERWICTAAQGSGVALRKEHEEHVDRIVSKVICRDDAAGLTGSKEIARLGRRVWSKLRGLRSCY